MESIGVKLQSYDLVAVHCVGKGKNRNVIIRFINRKYAFTGLRNSKKLATSNNPDYKKLYIIENLCQANKSIFNYLYKLKKENKTRSVWSFNGSVYFKKSSTEDGFGQKIVHVDDIKCYMDDSENSESDV